MEPLIKRLHGSVVHKGRMPEPLREKIVVNKEIDELKELLRKAVEEEQYEKAAEIRDRIRKIERERI
jgi:protein arginine kinase activator